MKVPKRDQTFTRRRKRRAYKQHKERRQWSAVNDGFRLRNMPPTPDVPDEEPDDGS